MAAVFREEAGRLTGALVRVLGNFDLAEEVVQDSLVAALVKWPSRIKSNGKLTRSAEHLL